ncbi:Uma2 family endonuclease [Acaryochloris sp. IP29b_bin.148]|uniref:Uma2 family endonuclease n=1 Tax=Acaryochloris sp. IP29b_bin.148 TaxID=2969218 RepID=UPI0026034746|nr:Uma2 family endonuclease [Acaryochloris sp. IP29b_bin.148]
MMVLAQPSAAEAEIIYPSSDGEPLAETSVHVDAIIHAVVTLRQHLASQRAIVLADQFLYYAQGYPKLRVAPDIMAIWDVPPGPRDNYKIWEEGSVPSVIFEITSEGTQNQDQSHKKTLYEQMEVQEYWLFDPKGEWIAEKLRGYRLRGEQYEPIMDGCSLPLKLRLQVDDTRIGFYREDGEKLLAPDELVEALQTEVKARQDVETQLEQERQRAEKEQQRAEQERQRAEQAEMQVQALMAKLKAMETDIDESMS